MDFTSALYLGLRHRHAGCWSPLTTGKPLALESRLERQVATNLAHWMGSDDAVLGPSTLHLSFDLFATFDPTEWSLFVDRDSYPILQWGSAQLTQRGMQRRLFHAMNPASLRRVLSRHLDGGRKPLVMVDGWNLRAGQLNPLPRLLAWIRAYQGLLIVDDTQSLGLLGSGPSAVHPWGLGGNGSLALHGMAGAPDCLIIASLAKGLGVPIAVLTGPRHYVQNIRRQGKTRIHTSPPSNIALLAAQNAMRLNRLQGESLRRKLQRNIGMFQFAVNRAGLSVNGGLFPFQRIACKNQCSAMHSKLQQQNINTLLLQGNQRNSQLGIILRADHSSREILNLINALQPAVTTHRSSLERIQLLRLKSGYADMLYSAFSFARNC